jgi:hypothetical protein
MRTGPKNRELGNRPPNLRDTSDINDATKISALPSPQKRISPSLQVRPNISGLGRTRDQRAERSTGQRRREKRPSMGRPNFGRRAGITDNPVHSGLGGRIAMLRDSQANEEETTALQEDGDIAGD